MRPIHEIMSSNRLAIMASGADGLRAFMRWPGIKENALLVIASCGGGWDHVSASFRNRCPTWDEMCIIKDIFFEAEECVVQFHPPMSKYVNKHPFCLHLWKRQDSEYETPPMLFVG